MDGLLPRAPTGRPRIAAVGAILVLCLVAAPTMSLFPIGVWNISHALFLSGAGTWALLLAPVAVGGMLLMWLLATRWLMGAGVNHTTSTAALVVGTAMAVPVILALLAPSFSPLPGDVALNSAAVTALVTTVAMGVCMLAFGARGPWQPGVLPGVAVVLAALLVLPLASEHMRGLNSDQRSLAQVEGFTDRIAVLDHPEWTPIHVHEVREGLRVGYARTGEETGDVQVISWSQEHAEQGLLAGCDFSGVECVEEERSVLVHRGGPTVPRGGVPSEIRIRLSEDVIASVRPAGATREAALRTAAGSLRLEHPNERTDLAEAIVSG